MLRNGGITFLLRPHFNLHELYDMKDASSPQEEQESSAASMATPAESTPKKAASMSPKKAFALGLGGALGCVVLLGLIGAVYVRPLSAYARAATRVLPFPAGFAGGTWISMKEFLEEEDVLLKSGEVDSTETRQGVMEALISKAVVDALAKDRQIALDTQKAEAYYQEIVAQVGDEAQLAEQLQTQFGVDVPSFKERVVRSIVLAGQVEEAIKASDADQVRAKQEAEEWRLRFMRGDSVADMQVDAGDNVRLYDGQDAEPVALSALPEEAVQVIAGMSVGDTSEVIVLPETYAVVRLIDASSDEDPMVLLDLAQIAKYGLEEAIDDYTATNFIWSFTGRVSETTNTSL